MSLYNFLFGENKDTDVLLGVIGFTKADFGRFRDIFLNPEGDIISVLTRLGGGNRKEYKTYITNARNSELYIKDYDDKYDSTYAYFKFRVPEKYSEMCKSIAPKEKRKSIKQLFDDEIRESNIEGTDANKRMKQMADEIFNQLNSTDIDSSDGSNNIKFIGL